ncbi:hypothetical protein [Oceanirhabdus sp. W0125-5]|uniref:hypothetical protein n=1 Tax=Oceanirhabdus sp. W0125-5 TaxID=2999116 RepID=UPI0022F2B5B8|nr:hypothetical protein [Oceanirhabdus sp. W0125-5]WBW96813.1 hypothetical protein OW730_24450 [Oceanirhabdus sp. W0125-5]
MECLKGLWYGITGTVTSIATGQVIENYKNRTKDKSKEKEKAVAHGNSKRSKKRQHVYEIYNIADGDVVKTGISGGKVRRDGKSYRAERQVRVFNKLDKEKGITYASRIIAYCPDRISALTLEWYNTQYLYAMGNSMKYHKIPGAAWDFINLFY